ncbi:hypothetical protein KAR48_10265 [bacterium]|nr:hypothetical protein [bacterium]
MQSEIIIVPAIFFSFVAMIKIIGDNRTRQMLIQKGLVDENIKYLYKTGAADNVPSAIKWGLVLIGIGLAFIIGQLVPYELRGEITVGGIFILAGLGLVIYYFLARRMNKKS